jgi:hypothetical protein
MDHPRDWDQYSFYELTIELGSLRDLTKSLKSEALRSLAEAFLENTESTSGIMALPLWFAHQTAERSEFNEFLVVRLVERLMLSRWQEPGEIKPLRSDEVAQEWSNKRDPNSEELKTRVRRELRNSLAGPGPQNAFRNLVLSTVSGLWTSFEVLTTDLWVTAVNAYPHVYAGRCLARAERSQDSEDFDGKQVSVRLLSKYGFDLRQKLGEILRPKFDFTCLSGQSRAFTAAFGRADELESIFADANLNELEATRHVIVHRAAVADEEFIRRTGSHNPVGVKIQIEPGRAISLLNIVLLAGCKLLKFVDERLESQSQVANLPAT